MESVEKFDAILARANGQGKTFLYLLTKSYGRNLEKYVHFSWFQGWLVQFQGSQGFQGPIESLYAGLA